MSHPAPSREAIVATAHESIARGSKSFAAASLLFDKPTRERAWLLYAWCRACDDLTDGQALGHDMKAPANPKAAHRNIVALTDKALAGEPTGVVPFDALSIVARESRIPRQAVTDHLDGFALDAKGWTPKTEEDLLHYCFHVAGAVGVMMALVMGVDPDDEDTLDRACDLGMAFQLANIARDIEEDDRVGRCYLPIEWLVEMDFPPGQHMKPPFRSRLAVLSKRMADRAAAFEASAREGTPALSLPVVNGARQVVGLVLVLGGPLARTAWYPVDTGGTPIDAVLARLYRTPEAGSAPRDGRSERGPERVVPVAGGVGYVVPHYTVRGSGAPSVLGASTYFDGDARAGATVIAAVSGVSVSARRKRSGPRLPATS